MHSDDIYKAIEFGAKQERERSEFMHTIVPRLALNGSIDITDTARIDVELDGNKVGTLTTKGAALVPHKIGKPRKAKAVKAAPIEPANPHRSTRQTGVAAAVRLALGEGELLTFAELANAVDAKQGTIRAALHQLKKKGLAIFNGQGWRATATAQFGNGSAHAGIDTENGEASELAA